MPDVETLRNRALSELSSVANSPGLEEWRLTYLGRQGAVTQLLRGLGELPLEERRRVGAAAPTPCARSSRRRSRAGAASVEQAALDSARSRRIDVTLPGREASSAACTRSRRRCATCWRLCSAMGFQVAEGPEVESDTTTSTPCASPKHHPARDTHGHVLVRQQAGRRAVMLLRTQTSPNQIRFMEQHQPPVRVAVPGRVYRYEATDATHEWMFYQVELLAVDEGISMAT